MKMRKKGVSPVVATVLLIMIVIIIAIIILLWSRGFIKEVIEKEIAGKTKVVEQYCSEVSLDSVVNAEDGSFGFHNKGVVPIYQFYIKLASSGESKKVKVEENAGVNPGFKRMITEEDVPGLLSYSDYEEVKIIPILLGKKRNGETQPFECPETDAIKI